MQYRAVVVNVVMQYRAVVVNVGWIPAEWFRRGSIDGIFSNLIN
jgi:hypothetical protein